MSKYKTIKRIEGSKKLSAWEKKFLKDIKSRLSKEEARLSSRQNFKLNQIIKKVDGKNKKHNIKFKRINFSNKPCKIEIPEDIKEKLFDVLKDEKNYNLYLFGSHIYGTSNEKSDYDFYVIFNGSKKREQHLSDLFDITFIDKETFISNAIDGDINSLEILSGTLIEDFEINISVKINSYFIQKAIAKGKHSLMKGSRLIRKDLDDYRGFKSFYHSLRILNHVDSLVRNGSLDIKGIKEIYKKERSKSKFNKEFSNKARGIWAYIYD